MAEGTAAPAPAATPAQAEGQPQSDAAPQAADPLAELEAVLKKAPLKYKANGKERTVADARELLRKVALADGLQPRYESTQAELAKLKALAERTEALKAAKSPRERVAILREFAGDGFDEAAEEAILERIQREQEMGKLPPEARREREERERLQAELEAYRQRETQTQEQQRRAQEEAENVALLDELASISVRALEAAKLPKEAAPDAARRLSVLVARAEAQGRNLTPEDLAGDAVKWAAKDFKSYTAGLEGASLLDFLGVDVAAKVAKALLAKQDPSGVPAPPPVPTTSMPSRGPGPATGERRSPSAAWNDLLKGR